MMAHIVCWRSGEVTVSRRVPKGSIQIVSGHGTRLKNVLSAQARHAYDKGTLLVPGVPEADTDLQAIAAVKRFQLELNKAMAKNPLRRRGRVRLI